MSFVETWTITGMSRRPVFFDQQNIASDVAWRFVVSDGQNSWQREGRCLLGMPGENPTPFEELTEQQVVMWVQDALGNDFIQGMRYQGTAYLLQKNGFSATVVTTMPWQNPVG